MLGEDRRGDIRTGLGPLREPVLSGRFFGSAAAETVQRLADFVATPASAAGLVTWFGQDTAIRLWTDRKALRAAIDYDICQIDVLIGRQLDAVLHAPRLKQLEGRWRGLHWLMRSIDPSARLRVKLLDLGWPELCRDLSRAVEFDQSHLFRFIYEGEFGMPGGEPFGLLIIDHEVSHIPSAAIDDVSAIAMLSEVAAAAFVPVVLPASSKLFEVDEFADLAGSASPAAPLRSANHARWRSLAGREDMRFVCVVLPRVLARPPWRDQPGRHDGFRYVEYAPTSRQRVWMTAGYAFASCVARAFAAHSWPADVRGMERDREGGGVVLGMPIDPFGTDPAETWARFSVELSLTDSQDRELIEAGFMPLNTIPFSREAVFSAVRSLQDPKQYTGDAATANARISAQINSILCASRFAHYLKVLGREMVGSMGTPEEVEQRLQRWLTNYVNGNVVASRDSRARQPLLSGRVEVTERPGQPGVFGCVIHLQPHFQLDNLSARFRLVTEIAAPGRAA